jgi:thiol-disulfide isomerase/thioredoxin
MNRLPFTLKKSHIVTLIALVLIVLVVSALAYYLHLRAYKNSINEANKTLFNADAAAAYVDMQGNQATLESYRGSVLVVNDWASWSPYAVAELPLLEKIAGDFAGKKIAVLAVNRKEINDQAQRFLNTIEPLPHVKVIIDTKDYFYGATGGYAMPETLIYNQDGVLIDHIRGVLQYDALHAEIANLLK